MSIDDPIKSGRVKKENFLGAVIDHESKQFRVYTNDMLINRYSRDSVNVAKSFDKLCGAQMKKISELYSRSIYYIGDGFVRAAKNSDDVGVECGKLLMNAMQTITASVELLRNGYILQPGMLLRSIIETFSLISYILLEPNAFNEFKGGRIDINSTIKYGKKVLPPLGEFQGLLSNNFVHISHLHSEYNIITVYDEMTEPLDLNLGIIKNAVWMLYVITELVYYNYFDKHLFWDKKNKYEYIFKGREGADAWMKDFFDMEGYK
ncbi:hypothetical protein [Ruminiclostridium josui]|uniref:hypothetical protein n=1 Tax=Ruminiclostridium josui TaxID=1499 RepID=UPI0004657535|nr:hypothetical protein [Ruminiclostridium josui]